MPDGLEVGIPTQAGMVGVKLGEKTYAQGSMDAWKWVALGVGTIALVGVIGYMAFMEIKKALPQRPSDIVNDIKDEVKQTVNDIKNEVKDTVNDVKNEVKDTINDAKDTVNDVKNDAKETINDIKNDVNTATKPVQDAGNWIVSEFNKLYPTTEKKTAVVEKITSAASTPLPPQPMTYSTDPVYQRYASLIAANYSTQAAWDEMKRLGYTDTQLVASGIYPPGSFSQQSTPTTNPADFGTQYGGRRTRPTE